MPRPQAFGGDPAYRVVVVGLGYVGLSTAVCLSSKFKVTGIDTDPEKIALTARGLPPFYEPGLPRLLKERIQNGMLECSASFDSVRNADIVFLTVGTPSAPGGGIDLSHVMSAAELIGRMIGESSKRVDVLLKSTVVPGTARGVMKMIEESSGKSCGDQFGLCSNPEFLREGSAIEDTLHPDRLVVGPFDPKTGAEVVSFYRAFYGGEMPPVTETSPEMAELTKYASNAFLAMKVSFINTVARICEKIPQGDVDSVARGIGLDRRIGTHFLVAGPGFGGSCFPKDVRALVAYAKEVGVDVSLLESTLKVNESQPEHIVSTAEKMLGGLEGRKVAILGLSFNPNTDDVRESRSLVVVEKLVERGARVAAYDPMAMERARPEIGRGATVASTTEECVRGADLAIVMTPWDEFRRISEDDFARLMKTPRVIDAWRIYEPSDFLATDFAAVGLGAEVAVGGGEGGANPSLHKGDAAAVRGVATVPRGNSAGKERRLQRRISADVVVDDERYTVTDYNLPEGLTLSTTELRPNKATRGHLHPTPECYVFFDGCKITVGNEVRAVKAGEMVYIGPNEFHRVEAAGGACRFASFFLGDRASLTSTYSEVR